MGTYNKVLDSLNFVQETQKYTLSSFQESQELEITLKKKVWELWTNILKHYRTRKLTYESDFLPALSGLATRLQQAGMGTYLASLWGNDLAHQLAWSTAASASGVSRYRPLAYVAPSFSFASRVGNVRFEPSWCFETQFVTILKVACHPKGVDPTGQVSSGFVTVRAPLLATEVEEVKFGGGRLVTLCRRTRSAQAQRFYLHWEPDTLNDASSIALGSRIHLLLLFAYNGNSGPCSIAMILKEDTVALDKYNRIGLTSDADTSIFEGCQAAEITVVECRSV